MLTISELASYAGVTVRAVRHYHAKGLLPEPERDRSGYRRYGGDAVVDLIRIRTLAGPGSRWHAYGNCCGPTRKSSPPSRTSTNACGQRSAGADGTGRRSPASPPAMAWYCRRRWSGTSTTCARAEWTSGSSVPNARAGSPWLRTRRGGCRTGSRASASSSPTRGSSAPICRWGGRWTATTRTGAWPCRPTTSWPTSRGWPTNGVRTTSATSTSSRRSRG